MDLLSPGENVTPAALANSLGAPAAAENAPLCPVTKWCTPPPEAGSANVTACPAFTVALLPLKVKPPIRMVAAPAALEVAVGGAVVAVALAGRGVAVGAGPPGEPAPPGVL